MTQHLGDFDVEAMQCLVHDIYHNKKYPTLDSLLLAVNGKGCSVVSVSCCGIFLHKMGLSTRRLTIRSTLSNSTSST